MKSTFEGRTRWQEVLTETEPGLLGGLKQRARPAHQSATRSKSPVRTTPDSLPCEPHWILLSLV
eukprot:4389189-Alexandrium_andersonii.AAC.1